MIETSWRSRFLLLLLLSVLIVLKRSISKDESRNGLIATCHICWCMRANQLSRYLTSVNQSANRQKISIFYFNVKGKEMAEARICHEFLAPIEWAKHMFSVFVFVFFRGRLCMTGHKRAIEIDTSHIVRTHQYRMLWMNLHAENRKRKIHLTLNAHSIPEISDSEQSPHGNKCHSNIYIYILWEGMQQLRKTAMSGTTFIVLVT